MMEWYSEDELQEIRKTVHVSNLEHAGFSKERIEQEVSKTDYSE